MSEATTTTGSDPGGSEGRRIGAPVTRYLFDLGAELEARLDVGDGPLGRRYVDRVRSGTFDGPRLRGELVPGGGDPLLYRRDGVAAIDAAVILRTDDGALIRMTYVGRVVVPDELRPAITDLDSRHEIDPRRYYIRAVPVFETGARQYRWLNGVVAVASGYLTPAGIGYRVDEVL